MTQRHEEQKRERRRAEREKPVWVQFWDMHSGGGTKVKPFDKIYIEAGDEDEARAVFSRLFGRDADHVTCSCCGADYTVDSHATLAHATGYHRGCAWDANVSAHADESKPDSYREKVVPLEEYVARPDVRVIPRSEWEAAR